MVDSHNTRRPDVGSERQRWYVAVAVMFAAALVTVVRFLGGDTTSEGMAVVSLVLTFAVFAVARSLTTTAGAAAGWLATCSGYALTAASGWLCLVLASQAPHLGTGTLS